MFGQSNNRLRSAKETPDLKRGCPQEGEQKVFNPKLPLNLPARCAQRYAGRYLSGAAQHPDQSQPGEDFAQASVK